MKDCYTLLIVDDNENDRELYRDMLLKDDQMQWLIVEAGDSTETLDIFSIMNIDIVLLDYALPNINGLELLKKIKAINDRIPVIMFSGQDEEQVAHESVRSGAIDYLVKDLITEIRLQNVIHMALNRSAMQADVDERSKSLESKTQAMAHDLGTPIQNMIEMIKVMGDLARSKNYEALKECAILLEKSAVNVEQLMYVIMKHNQVKQEALSVKPVSMKLILQNVLQNIALTIKEKNAQITYNENLPVISCSESHIMQLLQNLIDNAIKFCDKPIPSIQIEFNDDENHWVFIVKDNGMGIPEKDKTSIFEMFRRAHSDQQIKGSGIGLALCGEIVYRHGGEIWCESVEGQGASFFFTILKNLSDIKNQPEP